MLGEESGQAIGDDHALDRAEPGLQLRDAVQQDQCAQRDAQHQLAEVLHCRLVHGRVPRWLVGHIMAGTGTSRSTSPRSEEHTSELQSLMRISYDVFCLKKK